MRGRLTAIKNIAWALAIVLCLLAVFVGLLFAAFTRNSGEQFRGGVPLGTKTERTETVEETGTRPPQQSDGTLQVPAETGDAGQAYLDSLSFLIDSTLIGLRDYGVLTSASQVWTTPSGVLAVSDIAESKIVFPNDGSIVSAANAAMILQPRVLVISVGNDGIANIDQYDFMDKYAALIISIQRASPSTWILCLPLSSVTAGYSESTGLTSQRINDANSWIQDVCAETGALYCDAVSSVQDLSGALMDDYASADGKTLNSTGVSQILQYLRYHAVGLG